MTHPWTHYRVRKCCIFFYRTTLPSTRTHTSHHKHTYTEIDESFRAKLFKMPTPKRPPLQPLEHSIDTPSGLAGFTHVEKQTPTCATVKVFESSTTRRKKKSCNFSKPALKRWNETRNTKRRLFASRSTPPKKADMKSTPPKVYLSHITVCTSARHAHQIIMLFYNNIVRKRDKIICGGVSSWCSRWYETSKAPR